MTDTVQILLRKGRRISTKKEGKGGEEDKSFCSSRQTTMVFVLVPFLFILCLPCVCSETDGHNQTNHTLQKLNRINAHLKLINKPSIKTIKSPDGDLIDCIMTHKQPAFDHPALIGEKPLVNNDETSLPLIEITSATTFTECQPMQEPPERPRSNHSQTENSPEKLQLWTTTGETCPEGTIPIRRTREEDFLRASAIEEFGRKAAAGQALIRAARSVRRDSSSNNHEHAVGYVTGDKYYGAKASISVWTPRVSNPNEFSLSQMWVIAGRFGDDLNTIEAGWQVSPELYGDGRARFFIYWTTDAYRETGCYNLLCSGFVQTNNKIALGAAISPTSIFNGRQFDITVLLWKDPKHGNWWLELGTGTLVGYWPASLFSRLKDQASMVQYGGEIVNSAVSGFHTTTQMGSGHFAQEGFRRSSYFRNLQVVDWDNNLIPPPNLRLLSDHSNCYSIQGGNNRVWGNYFYYGGPGRNPRCP